MAQGDVPITIVGNLTGDPELRYSASGHAVAGFTVAATPRSFNRQSNEWVDGETLFMRCSAWREMAENVAESLTRGTRVIVTGRLRSRTYDTREGEKRTVSELEVEEVGPSLRYATTKVSKTTRGGGNLPEGGSQVRPGTGGEGSQVGGYGDPRRTDDPWATGTGTGGGYAGAAQDPPF